MNKIEGSVSNEEIVAFLKDRKTLPLEIRNFDKWWPKPSINGSKDPLTK